MCPMGKTVQVAADRAYDQSRTVLPAEVARGTYMQNPPGLAALKLMHLLIAKAGGRMGEDVEHRVRLSEVRGVEGLRNHDRASLAPLFAELQAAVLIHDDTEKKRLTIGGLLDIAEVDYRDELSGDLVISWYFSRMFTRAAAASNHWAILDRQTVFHLGSKYSLLLFQHIASLAKLDQVASKIFTVAELLISPVGLSATTKLGPKKYLTQMVALYFLSIALGTALAGVLAGYYDATNEAPFFIWVGLASVVTGVVVILASKPIHRLMAGVD